MKAFDAATVQGLWRRTNKKQRIFFAIVLLIIFFLSGGFATILALFWALASLLVYVFSSNAGFIIASNAVPIIIERFNKKNYAPSDLTNPLILFDQVLAAIRREWVDTPSGYELECHDGGFGSATWAI
ncbi:MAG: hypothetical protein ACYCZB_15345, partial [Acidiphilium sp.]